MTAALADVTVIDFGRFVSGSYTTMLLAALGAEVIKVERLPDGDPYRVTGAGSDGESALFNCLNSGKKSLALDFDAAEDLQLLDDLIVEADVFVENARPGSLRRLGLDSHTLQSRNPRLVYASISAFGHTGPDSARGGFDLVLQAESGLMSVTGDPATGPAKIGVPLLDIGAGLSCLVAVLVGLAERSITGTGSHVKSSLFEFGLSGFITQADSILRDGSSPGLLGCHSPSFAPYGSFRCADRPIILAGAGSEALWQKLCEVVELPELVEDRRFSTNAQRLTNRDELTKVLETRLSTAPAGNWLSRFEAAGIPAGEVRSANEALQSAQSQALGSLYEAVSSATPYWSMAAPFRIGVEPVRAATGAPSLGAHNDELRARFV